MPNIRDIRRRIKSIESTRQITKAMELVAAAKVRRAQERVLAARPYAEKIDELYRELVANLPAGYDSPLMEERPLRKVGLLVLTSDKGLSGSYNINNIRLALHRAAEWEAQGKEVAFYAVGNKGIQALKRSFHPVVRSYSGLPVIPSAAEARGLVEDLVEDFQRGEVDRVELVYTRFLSLSRYEPTVSPFLPARIERQEGKTSGVFLFEPSAGEVFDRIVPKRLETNVYRSLLEAAASALASQMNAMGNATKNAGEMIRSLSIVYNKARQAAITREILEVVGGAEALKG